jgi:hypothetical protein
MSRSYLSCADTAKLVRQALKESFPGVKFSVKSSVYSGGASISVRYEDGPAAKLVEAVTGAFNGSYFDGMIDYKGSVYAALDGNPVRFGADFIFVYRKASDAQVARAIAFLKAKYSGNNIEASVAQFNGGELCSVFPTGGDWSYWNSLQEMINAALSKLSSVAEPEQSATLARVASRGDDGYGQGTVGQPDGDGGDQCAKAQCAALERQSEQAGVVRLLAAPALGGVQ